MSMQSLEEFYLTSDKSDCGKCETCSCDGARNETFSLEPVQLEMFDEELYPFGERDRNVRHLIDPVRAEYEFLENAHATALYEFGQYQEAFNASLIPMEARLKFLKTHMRDLLYQDAMPGG